MKANPCYMIYIYIYILYIYAYMCSCLGLFLELILPRLEDSERERERRDVRWLQLRSAQLRWLLLEGLLVTQFHRPHIITRKHNTNDHQRNNSMDYITLTNNDVNMNLKN